jgi:hypothetical protein
VGLSWLAIALAAGAADLSDESRPAIGPTTIYVFMLVGGLYNVVLAADASTRARFLALYVGALAAVWADGVRQATVCLDAEVARERRLTLGDAAAFVIAFALGRRGLVGFGELAGYDPLIVTLAVNLGVAVLLGVTLAFYLAARRAPAPPHAGLAAGAASGVALGLAAGVLVHAVGFSDAAFAAARASGSPAAVAWGAWALVLPILLAEELLFSGVVFRGLDELLREAFDKTPVGAARARGLAVAGTVAVAVVAVGGGAGAAPLGVLCVMHGTATVTRAATGRISASFLARVAAAAVVVAWGPLTS